MASHKSDRTDWYETHKSKLAWMTDPERILDDLAMVSIEIKIDGATFADPSFPITSRNVLPLMNDISNLIPIWISRDHEELRDRLFHKWLDESLEVRDERK